MKKKNRDIYKQMLIRLDDLENVAKDLNITEVEHRALFDVVFGSLRKTLEEGIKEDKR